MDEPNPALPHITPEILLQAYAAGYFPMADSASSPQLHWVEPQKRGVIPLEGFHLSSKLRRLVASDTFDVRIDQDFEGVMRACAAPREAGGETWINAEILRLYKALFAEGYCHSVEVYESGKLVGGLYGLALGGAFFGESMFHRARDASKVALVHLVARLKAGGFSLLDTQFITDHLRQFGAEEIPRRAYLERLDAALEIDANFMIWDAEGLSGRKIIEAF